MRIALAVALTTNQLCDASLTLHKSSSFSKDPRPRVKATFLKNEQNVGFSLMFDVSSASSRIVMKRGEDDFDEFPAYFDIEEGESIQPAFDGEGYEFNGIAPKVRGGLNLVFGGSLTSRTVRTQAVVGETVRLFSGPNSFEFDSQLHILNQEEDMQTGIGVLGARFDSEFAQAAGIFALHPNHSQANPSFIKAQRRFGKGIKGSKKLFIGREQVESAIELVSAQTDNQIVYAQNLDTTHWVIYGSIMGHNGPLVLSTSTMGMTAPKRVIEEITAAFTQLGAVKYGLDGTAYERNWGKCQNYKSLPNIVINLGSKAEGSVEIILTPDDYVVSTSEDLSMCQVKLTAETADSSGSRAIGIEVLSKVFTVFDRENNRVGILKID